MNRDAMIEALAVKLEDYRLGRDGHTSGEAAAAVLDLCGPEPLVWTTSRGDDYILDATGDWCITVWRCNVTKVAVEFECCGDAYPTLDAAQAAAQDHATATHWANTPLGKMVQP